MFPAELARFISEESISVWYSVPSALTLLVTRGALQPGAFPQLRTILFAGEVFPMKYLLRLMDLLPHVLFHNLYGPTETNVCTWYEVPRFPDGGAPATIPIGRAIPNVDAYSVDDRGEPVGLGEVGELYVAGPTVMHGYWGDPERTSNALFEQGGSRVYRTGDLVQEGADGNFLFLGRRDAQIKSRGYRIELGEIETALYEHPLVAECAVVAMLGRVGDEQDQGRRLHPLARRRSRSHRALQVAAASLHDSRALRVPGRATEVLNREDRAQASPRRSRP